LKLLRKNVLNFSPVQYIKVNRK